MADFEVTFDIQQPSIEAEFELDSTEIDAVFEINATANRLDNLQDVSLTSPTEGQGLIYDSTTQKWVNGSPTIAWGSINGNITDQADLQTALGNKQDTLTAGSNIQIDSDNTIRTTTFVYEQGVAASTWNIQHNLNKKPAVMVVDSAGNEIACQVTYTDENNCVISANASFKGKAFLN